MLPSLPLFVDGVELFQYTLKTLKRREFHRGLRHCAGSKTITKTRRPGTARRNRDADSPGARGNVTPPGMQAEE